MSSTLPSPTGYGSSRARAWSIVIGGILFSALTLPGDVAAAPHGSTEAPVIAGGLRPNQVTAQAQPPAMGPEQTGSIVPVAPSLPAQGPEGRSGSPGRADRPGSGITGRPTARLTRSLVYSSLGALVIAASGLLLLGSRRRRW